MASGLSILLGSVHTVLLPGCFCKGFGSYHMAWDFFLGITHREPDPAPTLADTSIPSEPPEHHTPPEPSDVAMPHSTEDQQNETTSHVVPQDPTDDDSHATYDYNVLLPKHRRFPPNIPHKVHVQDCADLIKFYPNTPPNQRMTLMNSSTASNYSWIILPLTIVVWIKSRMIQTEINLRISPHS